MNYKQKIYEYLPTKYGYAFSKTYPSKDKYLKENYPNDLTPRPLFNSKLRKLDSKTEIQKDGRVISLYRVGKEKIRELLKIYNNPYKTKTISSSKYRHKKIGMYNIEGKKIAEFYDSDIASKLLKISKPKLQYSIKNNAELSTLKFVKFKLIN